MKTLFFVSVFACFSASADTIWHCKGYGGGTFWASSPCSNHQAHIDRIATVPGNMPFSRQVEIADVGRKKAERDVIDSMNPQIFAVPANSRCAALKTEKDKIWSRYSNWQFQPPEVVGPDRQRTLGIEAEQRRLGCPTQ